MGYLRPEDVDQVDLPTKGYWVKMRSRVTGNDHALSLTTAIDEVPAENPALRYVAQAEVLAISLIKEWNLTDEDDASLSISRENLRRLDRLDYDFILAEAMNRRNARPEEKEVPFVKRSRQLSKATR